MQKLFSLLVLLVFIGSCQNSEKKGKKQPTATQPTVVHPDTFKKITSMDNATIFTIDTAQSIIMWHCENHRGLVNLNGGQIFVRKDQPVGAYVEAITKTGRDTSITYKLMQGTFNNVLQTVDFFDSAHYPLLKFRTSDIQHNEGQFTVNGEISVRNIIKPLQFQLTSFRKKDGQLSLESADIPIDRTLFGMELNSRSFPKKAKDFIFSDTFFVKVVLFAEAM